MERNGTLRNAYLGLGSNLGERLIYLRLACRYLESLGHTRILRYSSVYKSSPIGYLDQPEFYNALIKIKTKLSPTGLLRCVKWIERSIGRKKSARRWGPRRIDIDIVYYGKLRRKSRVLMLPHRELYKRDFWLKPLEEISGRKKEYFSGRSWRELLKASGRKRDDLRKIYSGRYLND